MQPPDYKFYIGDSVYASFDGYHIILTTENGLPTDPSNTIALEPHVIVLLIKYRDRVQERLAEGSNASTGA